VNRNAAHALLLLFLVNLGCARRDEIIQLRLAHVASPDSLVAISADEFARRANEQLAGHAEIKVFGSSQLGDDETLLIKLKLGTVDFSIPSTIMSSAVESFGLFEMPYLVRDRDHMRRIEQEIIRPRFVDDAEKRGFKLLAVWENGFRHITNSKRPIEVPGDLAGIKLRTPRGHWRVRLFQSFGANPTPMSLSETFMALQTGVIDGQENPLNQIYSQKFYEVQEYLSLTGHVYAPAYLLAGADRWEGLPADVRETLETTARAVQAFVYARAIELEKNQLAELEASGIKVNRANRDEFVLASEPIFKQFGAEVPGGKEMIERALASGSN
jgi:tripartite ATP-independent transporter DctP family solute receptor